MQLLEGARAAVSALAAAGNRVIFDTVLQDPAWLVELAATLRGMPTVFVGVYCSPEVLDARERDRGDREVGMARRLHEVVHAHGRYDVEVDTSILSARQCAERVLQ